MKSNKPSLNRTKLDLTRPMITPDSLVSLGAIYWPIAWQVVGYLRWDNFAQSFQWSCLVARMETKPNSPLIVSIFSLQSYHGLQLFPSDHGPLYLLRSCKQFLHCSSIFWVSEYPLMNLRRPCTEENAVSMRFLYHEITSVDIHNKNRLLICCYGNEPKNSPRIKGT